VYTGAPFWFLQGRGFKFSLLRDSLSALSEVEQSFQLFLFHRSDNGEVELVRSEELMSNAKQVVSPGGVNYGDQLINGEDFP
jgi:phosphoribosylformylglycinamidine (FGAM) synthase-like amidotransferase family enzyme